MAQIWWIEFNLSGSTWTDKTADVIDVPVIDVGRKSVSHTGLVSGVGTINFELNNSDQNSGSLAGLYTPGHANQLSGFGIEMPVRLKTVYNGSTKYLKFYIKSIRPTIGDLGQRRVTVIGYDYIGKMQKKMIGRLVVQSNVTSDELYATLLNSMDAPPSNSSLDAGLDNLALAFGDLRSEKMTPISAKQKSPSTIQSSEAILKF